MKIKKLQAAGLIPKIGKAMKALSKKWYIAPEIKMLKPEVPKVSEFFGPKYNIPIQDPFPFTLVHRTSNVWPVEKGNFIFGNPITGHNMPAIHFSQQTPVVGHSNGSWGAETTTIMLPYRNIRSKVAPVSIEPMDTIFPNYNGLKISTQGAKILTGDRNAYNYYKSLGLNVTFSPEAEKIRMEYLPLQKTWERLDKSLNHSEYDDLRGQIWEQKQKLLKTGQDLHKRFVEENLDVIPTWKDMQRLIDVEQRGYKGTITKGADLYGDPLTEKLGYHWYYAPSVDEGLRDQAKTLRISSDKTLYGKRTPEQIKFIRWMSENGDDFRKLPEEIILPYHYEAPLVKWADTNKFNSIKDATKRLLEDRYPFSGEVMPLPEPLDFDAFIISLPKHSEIDLSQYIE